MQDVNPEIKHLPREPSLLRKIAGWHQREWGHLSERTVEDRLAEFGEHGTDIPLTLVAWLVGAPVGTVSLLAQDMDVHQELTPWLGSVYVLPQHRSRGIGTRLVGQAVAEAQRLGVATLYLFTEDRAGFYGAMGWKTMDTFPYHGETVTLMRLALAGHAP